MPILTFAAADDVTPRIAQVRQAAINSVKVMREVLDGEADALHALRRLKFDELGHNPLGPDRWNVIEQLNQTFTYLVSLAGARWLLAKHPDAGPICLNLGTSAGSDLESMPPGRIAAEAFAATSPNSDLHRPASATGRTPRTVAAPRRGYALLINYLARPCAFALLAIPPRPA